MGALRVPHLIAIGLVAVILGGGIPSHWFGLVSKKVTEVERLRECLARHSVEFTALVENLGQPEAVLGDSHAARAHAVRSAERDGRLNRREGRAIVECAQAVAG